MTSRGDGRSAAAQFVDALIEPSKVFSNPRELVDDPGLSNQQKRTILLAWTNDALGLEGADPGDFADLAPIGQLDALIEALEHFDHEAASDYRAARAHIRGEQT